MVFSAMRQDEITKGVSVGRRHRGTKPELWAFPLLSLGEERGPAKESVR